MNHGCAVAVFEEELGNGSFIGWESTNRRGEKNTKDIVEWPA